MSGGADQGRRAGGGPAKEVPPFLVAERLCFSYGPRQVLHELSFALYPGELAAIVGPNGCGKSTLLNILSGQYRAASGRLTVQAPRAPGVPAAPGDLPEDLARLSPAARANLLALVPQMGTVGFAYSVRQMVLMGRWPTHARSAAGGLATALGFETAGDHQVAEAAMRTADVLDLADRPVTGLSGGERQRVIIARALAQETPALLLDEPTSALDLRHQLDLLGHLRDLAQVGKKTVVLVTHDLNLAREYADRVLVLDGGRLAAEGPPEKTLTAEVLEPVYGVRIQRGSAEVLTFARREGR